MNKRAKWTRDCGKPYIRRANGKERAGTLRGAFELALFRNMYGLRGFYVMVQRGVGCPVSVMAIGKDKATILSRLAGVRKGGFESWARRIKREAQGLEVTK